MAIDARQVVSPDDAGQRSVQVALVPNGYVCSDCGYGIAVPGALPSCPMCGADAWLPERGRAGRAAPWPH